MGGWQMAEIEAAPARVGLIEPPVPAGIVVGEVETYCSDRPVSGAPLVSTAVAASGCVLFWLTTTGFVVAPGRAERDAMRVGKWRRSLPSWHALAILAEIRTDPGWLAVATPFWSMVTTDVICRDVLCAENCRWPAWQLMLVWLAPVPA